MERFESYVVVFFDDPKNGEMISRFVTGLEGHNVCQWEDGKPAMKLSLSYAKDIVFGLTLNGYAAGAVQFLKGVEIKNPEPKNDCVNYREKMA